ncbi:NAD(P)-dependent oxidoreductase [Clostridium sp. MD294]|uniref:precorrin-2 dehydrogenase/sirohydrochlorin ferrochelatase family protein n=1 Tax=Clostridium sp. MD294 TaxID=97138 RepID=UPI0002CCA5AC|nr:NAD(P)-dependent oxidoreductase [Clostridium sp. MD294]NDO47800.1 hypothetical protein [Clostridium sp. MD294]USF29880.1 Siroheme synthase [Clostridium sp. MD294]
MEKLAVFLSLEGRKVLVVGGGTAALIKIKTLLDIQSDFKVISKEYAQQTEKILKENVVNYQKKEIKKEDIKDVFIVFAAAEKNVNDSVAKWAKELNVLCCKADGKGDFILPYHKREGKLTVAVSTDGLFPLLGKKICETIDLSIGKELYYLGEKRKKIIECIHDKKERKKALEQLLKEYQTNEKKY